MTLSSRWPRISLLLTLFLTLAFPLVLSLVLMTTRPAASQPRQEQQVSGRTVVYLPEDDVAIDGMEERRAAQLATSDRFGVFHDFRLTDRLAESGITFRHRIVDDAGRYWKAVHYDHGNGVSGADVDGDGRLDLYFLSQLGSNELWRNVGGGRFENITASAGVAVGDRISVAASFGDIDNDGDPDLYVTTVKMGNLLFENLGGGKFRDISEASGTDYVGHSSASVFFDYDLDGLLDLLVVNVGEYTGSATGRGGYYIGLPDAFQRHRREEASEASRLYKNLGDNRFREVSAEVGLVDTSWSGDATLVDFNEDGYPDLYIVNMQGDDHYWENRGGKQFVDRTDEHFPKTSWGAMGVQVLDVENDGRFDLMVTDMHSDMAVEIGPDLEKEKSSVENAETFYSGSDNNILGNSLFRNLGDGKFVEASDEMGLENYWPWGVSAGDLNADGYRDVLIISSMNYPFRYGVNSLLLNDRGQRFRDAEFLVGLEPRPSGELRVPWFDLDCTGEDLGHQICAGREGDVTVMASAGSRSSIIFDLDDDGDLDIVTSEFNSVPRIMLSDLAERRAVRYLNVRLRGVTSNRDGLGSRVIVRAGERQIVRWVDGKSGYLSQSAMSLYFGLDDVERVDKVEVRWPTGQVQTVPGPIEVNRSIEIREQ